MTTKKNQNLQVVRGMAILMVLLMHTAVMLRPEDSSLWTKGLTWVHPAVGVDLFFVISGYLMGRIFLARADRNQPLLEASIFYRRRFARLIPAAFFWALVTLVIGLALAGYGGFGDQRDAFWKFFTSLAFMRNFEQASDPDTLGYFWSLSIEAQFYLLLPIAFFGLRRWFWPVVVGLLALSLFWRLGGDAGWLFRYDGLLIGLLVWRITSVPNWREVCAPALPQTKWTRVLALWLGAITMMVLPKALVGWDLWANLGLSVIGGYLVLMSLSMTSGFLGVTRWDAWVIAWLGEISYSVFLAHIPLFMALQVVLVRYDIRPGVLGYALALVSLLAISYGSYRWIEPLLENSTRIAVASTSRLAGDRA